MGKLILRDYKNRFTEKPLNLWVNVLIVMILLFSITACNSRQEKRILEKQLDNSSLEFSSSNTHQDINYKIPTPMELFLFMQEYQSEYASDMLHHPLKYKEYFNTYKKGLNFGIYSADLAYATIYDNNQDAILYFKAAKELATKLGLYEGYGQKIAERIDNNLQNIDSLIEIAADSYNESVIFLEDQGSTELLSLIITGGWIEALFICTQSIQVFDAENPIIGRIADQQILLENLLSYINSIEETNNLKSIKTDLKELQEVYDQLYFNDENTQITSDQFVNITNKVSDIRSKLISQQ